MLANIPYPSIGANTITSQPWSVNPAVEVQEGSSFVPLPYRFSRDLYVTRGLQGIGEQSIGWNITTLLMFGGLVAVVLWLNSENTKGSRHRK